MSSTRLVPGPAAPDAVTMRTSCPSATKRRANSYDRVPPTPARVTKNWSRYRIRTMPNASRALDIAVAAVMLAVPSPLLALAALAIRLESRGPVFYRQRRVGRNGEPFELWKLRTMVPKAETMGAGVYVLEGDPRITRVGRLLRRFSLDELPNLINVLKGEMAIVGPRPTVQEQVELDVWYVEHRSLWLDLKILAKTARMLATGHGLYSEDLKQGW